MIHKTSDFHHSDSSLSSFFTGAVVGGLAALMLGTEEGRRFGRNLLKTAKYLSEEIGKQATNLPKSDAGQRFEDFSQSVGQLNETIQNTGSQLINRLHRQAKDQYFVSDDQP